MNRREIVVTLLYWLFTVNVAATGMGALACFLCGIEWMITGVMPDPALRSMAVLLTAGVLAFLSGVAGEYAAEQND